MNQKNLFTECRHRINGLHQSSSPVNNLEYRKAELITLRYFFVRNRRLVSVSQSDTREVPVLRFVFLLLPGKALPIYMYQLLPGDFPFSVPAFPPVHRSKAIARAFLRWQALAASHPLPVRIKLPGFPA